jgi:predicted PurR-regulated permease PerM
MFNSKKGEFSHMRTVFFGGLIIVLAIAMLYLIRPFIYPIFWAAILAILFYPIFNKLLQTLKSPSISSLFTLIIIVMIIFLPLAVIATLLINQSVDLYQAVADGNWISRVQGVTGWLGQTALAPYVESIKSNWTNYAGEAAQGISVFLFENLKSITQNSVKFIFQLLIMLYTLFFFLKDGPKLLNKIMRLSPLGNEYEAMLYEKFTSTARATLRGTFLVGGIQGLLAGILFWAVGIKGALIWAVLTMAVAIVPAIGAFVIWLPTGIIMLTLGNIWQGITILIVGALIISTIDNFLRPIIVGKDTQMHTLIVLFATLGGIFIFGISGFVIGPIIAALFLSVASMYEHHYRHELDNN